MIGSVLIVAAILGYGAWVILRKVRQGRRMWKEGCSGCCDACGACKGKRH